MLRGALLGAGNVALNAHVPGWLARPEVAIVAGADPCPDTRESFLQLLPEARWYASPAELLQSETLDFVDVCTPPASHAPLLFAALGRGLHALCEKPLVTRLDELEPLAHAARRSDLALCTVHNWLQAPILAKLIELVRGGAVGSVRSCFWQTIRSQPAAAAGSWRTSPELSGGGILVDHGWHAFYVLLALMGEAPEAVRARLDAVRDPQSPVEDTAEVEVGFPSGSGRIFLTWAAEQRRNLVEVEGTEGLLRVDGDALELTRSAPEPVQRWTFPKSLAEGSHHPDWFDGVARGFLREIADPEARGANLSDAALCLTLLSLSHASSLRGGEWLPVPRSF